MTISRQNDEYKAIQKMNKALEDQKDDDMSEYNSQSDDKETESECEDKNESGMEIPSMETDDQAETPQTQFNTCEYFSHILHTDPINDVSRLKSDVENITHKMLSFIQPCNDVDTLKTVKSHLQSAVSVLQAKSNSENKENFISTITPAPNTNHVKQHRFFSTKKREK